jgi:hypothetical protein
MVRRALDQRSPLEGRFLMNADESADAMAVSESVISSPELDSVALLRLIQEVRTSEPTVASSYNRMHNRHNR